MNRLFTPGEEVTITRDGRSVAKLVPDRTPKRQPRKAGSARGMLLIVQDDGEHLKDFAEYME